MNKLLSFVLPLLGLLFSCESINESEFLAGEYFPLQIGNKWYYNSSMPETSTITTIWEIVDKKIMNNKNYFVFVEQHLNTNIKDTLYYRVNGDTLFSKTKNYDEQIEADFSLHLNEIAYWRKDLKVVEKTENQITFETPYGGDYGYTVTFQKGVGITNLFLNAWSYRSLKLIKVEIK